MRDSTFIPFDKQFDLVISSDNAANIGEKDADHIQAPYPLVAESMFRVAFMENYAVGAEPLSILLHNFSGEGVWQPCVDRVNELTEGLGLSVSVTGSTESNFPLQQSALSLTVMGKVSPSKVKTGCTPEYAAFAVIGEPLVGQEVMEKQDRIAPLSLFKELADHPSVFEMVPVGSKGILYELQEMLKANDLAETFPEHCSLDINKSGGPSTCFIISYKKEEEAALRKAAGALFHPLLPR
ncbi:hypothetical protein [Halobacillus kuroshimensis]|uniref:hypothetical protein n=1 Tax=Halobacillus kuroshimensis TaxID=302481 RepID=UPI000400415B|nr:hypothetical protein [Halobacillus kuroshimensis]